MHIGILSDLLELSTSVQVLYKEINKRTLRVTLSKDLTTLLSKEEEHNIYLMTTDGELMISVSFIFSSVDDGPKFIFKYKIENSLRTVTSKHLIEMVETQLENEAFLSNVKSENILIFQMT